MNLPAFNPSINCQRAELCDFDCLINRNHSELSIAGGAARLHFGLPPNYPHFMGFNSNLGCLARFHLFPQVPRYDLTSELTQTGNQ
jgi:hypothetical protein